MKKPCTTGMAGKSFPPLAGVRGRGGGGGTAKPAGTALAKGVPRDFGLECGCDGPTPLGCARAAPPSRRPTPAVCLTDGLIPDNDGNAAARHRDKSAAQPEYIHDTHAATHTAHLAKPLAELGEGGGWGDGQRGGWRMGTRRGGRISRISGPQYRRREGGGFNIVPVVVALAPLHSHCTEMGGGDSIKKKRKE